LAGILRGLGLVLIISMAATGPSSAIRVGSPDASRWWETDSFADLVEAAQARRAEGDFAGLASIYALGYQRAIALGNAPAQVAYLSNLGSAYWSSLQYARALETYLKASALAERTKDWTASGAIAVNLSLIYELMGDAEAALGALDRAKAAVDRATGTPPYKAQLLMRLRAVRADLSENAAKALYIEAVEAARQAGDGDAEASAWDLLGREQAAAGEFEAAETSIGRALRLRMFFSRKNLSFSYAALGALRLAQAEQGSGNARRTRAREAEAFATQAILTRGRSDPAKYVLLQQRGRARELLDKPELALQDFRETVKQAKQWNGEVPGALSLVNGANTAMQREMFDSFIQAATRKALRTGDRNWALEAFLAVESNRAASLRENRELAQVWRKKLPAAYWETLAKLNKEEVRDSEGENASEAQRLHLGLTEMESRAGVGFSVSLAENFRTRNSLIHFQQSLGESELFLSFYLGKRESYLWAVTRNGLDLYRIPPELDLRDEIRRYREAVLAGESAGDRLGADLYRRLFGSLKAEDRSKKSWLLSLDKDLFELPFAALVTGYKDGRPVYAAEEHSFQQVPGAMFLRTSPPSQGGYLGIADPVYNSADPRNLPGTRWEPGGVQLNRLVNGARELRRSAAVWRATPAAGSPVQILEGLTARRGAFLQALLTQPKTIHLATHVLLPQAPSEQALVAFSPDAGGQPELLSTREIGMLHVPGALVVMTGCSSGAGDAQAGTGLLGLTRAWLMAGASTVLSTNWRIPDADGDLIPAFYRHLGPDSKAEALRRSQVEMIHSGTWQAAPSYWAAFQVTGDAR